MDRCSVRVVSDEDPRGKIFLLWALLFRYSCSGNYMAYGSGMVEVGKLC